MKPIVILTFGIAVVNAQLGRGWCNGGTAGNGGCEANGGHTYCCRQESRPGFRTERLIRTSSQNAAGGTTCWVENIQGQIQCAA
ncbi:hypothetical protein HYFRA_00011487 [Hymenoscyphus fraxineus]|uniref:Hydrophobin n=1 Tax=Hymenoscyphus fraxineus TaxID=746836 RepID=A0A9N9KZU7_9HELO|nr:hypothetical protein HYFRA_00011487 [Hymenoscyphus fraxineus]